MSIKFKYRYIEKNTNIAILQIRYGYMKPSTQSTVISNVKRYNVFCQMRSLFLKQNLSPAHFQSAEIIPGV